MYDSEAIAIYCRRAGDVINRTQGRKVGRVLAEAGIEIEGHDASVSREMGVAWFAPGLWHLA